MLSPIAALESPYVQAMQRARRVTSTNIPDATPPIRETAQKLAVAATSHTAPRTRVNVDGIRDQYAEDRLRRAVEEYQASNRAQWACQGVAWGTIACLQPTQAYRVAFGNPPVEILGALAPVPLQQRVVSEVKNAALDDGFENARRRRKSSPHP